MVYPALMLTTLRFGVEHVVCDGLRQLLRLVPVGCPTSFLYVLFVAELSHGFIQDPRVPVSPGLWVLQPDLQPPARHIPLGWDVRCHS